MATIKSEIRKWGNSFGVIIPIETILKEKLKEREKVNLLIIKNSKKALKETWGIAKGKLTKPTQQIKDEIKEELYG